MVVALLLLAVVGEVFWLILALVWVVMFLLLALVLSALSVVTVVLTSRSVVCEAVVVVGVDNYRVFVALVLVGVDLSFPVITFVIFPFVVIVVVSGVNDCDSAVNGGAIALVLLVVRPMRFTVGVDLVAAGLFWWCCDVRVLSKLMNK